MVARRRSRIWLFLVLTCAWAASEASHAERCKKMLRTMFMDRCSFRSKRSAIDDLDPAKDFASEVEGSHTRKRQIMSIRQIILSSRVPVYDIAYPPYPSYARQAPLVPPTYANTAPRARTPESLPPESGADLGFEMSYEEMVELFEEFYERMPRTARPKDEMQKEYIPLFQECCKNEDRCLTRKEHLSYCPF